MRNDIVFMQTNEIPPRYERVLRLCSHACLKVTIFRRISISLLENEFVETNSYAVILE